MKRLSLGILGLLLLLPLAGCRNETFEQRVTRLRNGYTITPNGFTVRQTPPPVAPGAAAGEAPAEGEAMAAPGEETASAAEAAAEVAAETAEPEGEAAEGEAAPGEDGILVEDLMPLKQDVLLDLLVRNDNVRGSLPGLTLDITQVDAAGNAKAHWRAWIDTSEIGRGPGHQLSHVLEDVEFEEGDQFQVEVRSPVPPGERSEYEEFTPQP